MIAECSYTALDGFCRMTLDFKKKKQVKVETAFKWWKMKNVAWFKEELG